MLNSGISTDCLTSAYVRPRLEGCCVARTAREIGKGTMRSRLLWATTIALGLMLASTRAPAQQFIPVHTFATSTEGSHPFCSLTPGPNGVFYGVNSQDGIHNGGTLFRLEANGRITVIHSFAYPYVTPPVGDGGTPEGTLVFGPDGSLYGTTVLGGTADYGTIFKMTTDGQETILHNFGDGTVPGDGAGPTAGLTIGRDGNFYGTSHPLNGGASSGGTVYRVTANGDMTVLHTFSGSGLEGQFPGGLLLGSDGNFYGMAFRGGSSRTDINPGYGTIYRITPAGQLTVLHNFDNTSGAGPIGNLIEGTDGYLYGCTALGGIGFGTIFRIDKFGGNFRVLHMSTKVTEEPSSGLVEAPDGSFYGAAGEVFRITKTGEFVDIRLIDGGSGAPVFSSRGDLFGLTTNAPTYGSIYAIRFSPTHFLVSAPSSTVAGQPLTVTVGAFDTYGNVQHIYSGAVHFSSTDGTATLPGDAALVDGHGTFTAALNSTGSYTITAQDTVDGTVTGTTASIAVSPAAVALRTAAPSNVLVGVPFTVRVTAVDQFGHLAPINGRMVTLGTNSPRAVMPASAALVNGVRDFTVTLTALGAWKVTAYDNAKWLKAGTSQTINVAVGPAARLKVTATADAQTGSPFSITVSAFDLGGNPTAYSGTLHFTSTDGAATLPADTAFNGTSSEMFNVTLRTGGKQTITVTDTSTSTLRATTPDVIVRVPTYILITAPAQAQKGVAFNFMISVRDQYGDQVESYAGPIAFTSNDPDATLPSPVTLPNAVGTFSATMNHAGTFKITGVDTTHLIRSGTSGSITVSP